MSTKLLRDAAWKLRGAVANLPVRLQCDWESDGAEIYTRNRERDWVGETISDAEGDGKETAAFIVVMQPIVALALVDLLEGIAAYAETHDVPGPQETVLALARAILRPDGTP